MIFFVDLFKLFILDLMQDRYIDSKVAVIVVKISIIRINFDQLKFLLI